MKTAHSQTGVVLAVTLFMLLLLTIIGVSAVMMSTTHFRLIGNLQSSYEAEITARNGIVKYLKNKDDTGQGNEFGCEEATQFVAIPTREELTKVCIVARCLGTAPSPPSEGNSKSYEGPPNALWDVTAITKRDIFSATSVVHAGILLPASSHCPICPELSLNCE